DGVEVFGRDLVLRLDPPLHFGRLADVVLQPAVGVEHGDAVHLLGAVFAAGVRVADRVGRRRAHADASAGQRQREPSWGHGKSPWFDSEGILGPAVERRVSAWYYEFEIRKMNRPSGADHAPSPRLSRAPIRGTDLRALSHAVAGETLDQGGRAGRCDLPVRSPIRARARRCREANPGGCLCAGEQVNRLDAGRREGVSTGSGGQEGGRVPDRVPAVRARGFHTRLRVTPGLDGG